MVKSNPYSPIRHNPEGQGGIVILCDHASNHIPPELDGLGIDPAHLETHIALDIGAAEVSRYLADALDSPAVLATVSRLVVDPNRDHVTQNPIPVKSDGVRLLGNEGLDEAARKERLDRYFHPYHAACEDIMSSQMARGIKPIVIGLHSFTPVMDGMERPWEIGFLYDGDARLYHAMRGPLKERWGFHVGDNEPYSGAELYYTMNRHGEAHGLMQATIELRQDLIADEQGQRRWADILAEVLRDVMATQRTNA